jgi:hypothetical protein
MYIVKVLNPITLPNSPSLLLLNYHHIFPPNSRPKDIIITNSLLLLQVGTRLLGFLLLLLLLLFRRQHWEMKFLANDEFNIRQQSLSRSVIKQTQFGK